MHCNGKCHLKKEMQQDEQKKNTPFGTIKVTNHISLFSESLPGFKNYFPVIERIFTLPRIDNLSAGHLLSVFHPPAC